MFAPDPVFGVCEEASPASSRGTARTVIFMREAGMLRLDRLSLVLLTASILAPPLAAQTGSTVSGRVVEAGSNAPIPFASVELEGHGAVVAREDGSFAFLDVAPGGYMLWAASFGYAAVSTFVRVDQDMTVTVELQPAPIPLDPLSAVRIAFKGRVRDGKNEINLIDAEVLTNEGHGVETDTHGRFDIKGVLEGSPLRVRVQSFGYLPIDSVLSPERGREYVFVLQPDSAVEARIAVETARMQDKVEGFFSVGFRNMNRDRLLQFAGAHTMRTLVEFEGGMFVKRIKGVILDDEAQYITGNPLTELGFILPEELERAEFLWCGTGCTILRLYSRDYMRNLIAQGEAHPECTITAGAPIGLTSGGLAFSPGSSATLGLVARPDPIIRC
jgi:hypothetical protein